MLDARLHDEMVRLGSAKVQGDGGRKMNSQWGLDVYIPEAGEKPGKNAAMETKGVSKKRA